MLTHGSTTAIDRSLALDSDSSSLLGMAAVLPEQFYSGIPAHTHQPEAALMRAVLEEAFTCFQYQFYIRRTKALQLARDAEAWFFSDETSWPFTFVNICEVLQLDPHYIRRGLQRWKTNSVGKVQQRKRRTIGARRPLSLAA